MIAPDEPWARARLVAVGADGARGGWAVAALYADASRRELASVWETRLLLLADIGEVARLRAGSGAPVAIDIPIGLLDSVDFRPCDVAARRLLGRRASAVFAPPARYLLGAAGDYAAARALVARERRGNPAAKGLSAQAAGIARKVREVDEWARAHPDSERWLFECHPELSFLALDGRTAPLASKRSAVGADQRRGLIRSAFPDAEAQLLTARRPATEAGMPDWLDAYAALCTAVAIVRGEQVELGGGARDGAGLPMRIVHPGMKAGELDAASAAGGATSWSYRA